jgi:hypothetical protein
MNPVPSGEDADAIIARLKVGGALKPAGTPGTPGDSGVSPVKTKSDQRKQTSGDRGTAPVTHQRVVWTAKELLEMDIPEPVWAVRNLIPAGVALLAGAPKTGKSWLALGVAVAVATGGKALGKVNVDQGDVLFLALEDTPRRLQSRLRTMLGDAPGPEALTLVIECPPLGQGGEERIAAWLDQHPDARLVVVDVFARLRPTQTSSAVYQADYDSVAKFKAIADQHQVAMVLVHHTRKLEADDFVDAVSGTAGLGGAADAVLVLRRVRGKLDAVLHATGRDIQEDTYPLEFDADIGTWKLLEGPVDQYTLADTRLKILDHIKANQGATPKQIAQALHLDHELAKKTARRMVEDRQLTSDGQGHYFPVPLSPEGEPAGQEELFE